MTFRLWIGVWSSAFCLVIVALDLSAVVRYFTRFTEESFAALIGIIFIVESLKKLISAYFQGKNESFWIFFSTLRDHIGRSIGISNPA